MTKGQKLCNGLIATLVTNNPHVIDMTVRDACHNAYLADNYLLHNLLNVMNNVYPEYADKTFRYLYSRANDMEYKEYLKNKD